MAGTTTAPVRRAGGRAAVLETALRLFAEHGVSGTSLQMIADAMGVTKAAVYHHFRTKDEIVLAVLTRALDELGAIVARAEEQADHEARVAVVVAGLVDLLLAHRRGYRLLGADPAVVALLRAHPSLQALGSRIDDLLAGPCPDAARRVAVAFVQSGLRAAAVQPMCAEMDEATLRRHLVAVAHRALGAGEAAPGR
jgi:AcrR family transcriptional regulator